MHMNDTIYVGSEACGYYGKYAINFFLKLAFPNKNIVWENNEDKVSLIVRSSHSKNEPYWAKNKHKVIYFCIEWIGLVEHIKKEEYLDYLYFHNTLDPMDSWILKEKSFHIPALCNYIKMTTCKDKILREDTNIDRDRFLGYCHNNNVKERETMFNLLCNKSKHKCYSLSGCDGMRGKNKKCIKIKVGGNHKSQILLDEYKKYRFIMAMENKNIKGYITEKIINAFRAGAIPIYWGTDYIKNIFNPKAFIYVNDFNSLEECADYIVALDNDKNRRQQMLNENRRSTESL